MPSEKLQKILAMSKNMDKKATKVKQTQPTTAVDKQRTLNGEIHRADKVINNIDAMYNAPYVPSVNEVETWNTERGREELLEMANQGTFMEKLKKSKLPSAIIESMKQNPCNYDPSLVDKTMGPENEFFKKLNSIYGKEKEESVRGVKALQLINEKLDKRGNEKATESTASDTKSDESAKGETLDLAALEQMIERVIDRKLSAMNEHPSIKTMMLTDSGGFRFLDSEDNVYECQMKYLGKRKKKK